MILKITMMMCVKYLTLMMTSLNLAIEDLCVCDICEALNLNQTTVSNQLRILRANNIVKYQKEGKMARYSLTDLHIEMIYKVGLEHILE